MGSSVYSRLGSAVMCGIAALVAAAVVADHTDARAVLLGGVAFVCSLVVAREMRRDDVLAWIVFVCTNASTVCLTGLPSVLYLDTPSARPVWLSTMLLGLGVLGLLLTAARAGAAHRLHRARG